MQQALLLLIVFGITGCASIGPETMTRDRFDYSSAVAEVVAVCALLFVCFMAGLEIRTRTGARVNAQLEQVILRRVPGLVVSL